MAFTNIGSEDVDAKSPVDDSLMDLLRTNQDHIEQVLSDGASAPQTITTNKVAIASTASDALDVAGDSQFDGDVNIDGQLTTGSFFVSDLVQHLEDWA